MDQPRESLRKSALEPDSSSSEQDQARTSTNSDSGSTLLAQCSLIFPCSTDGSLSSLVTATTSGPDHVAKDCSSISTHELDALRMEIIRQQLVKKNLNAQAVEDLLLQRFAPTGTNQSYRKNQLRFVEWAIQHKVSLTAFSPSDLVNFLADMKTRHDLQASTLKTLRAAVAHLHEDPKGIRESQLINSYIDSRLKEAPPLNSYRPTIDVCPAIAFAQSIASRTNSSIKRLQQKLAFLLAMAAFLRPSDLARIPFASCSITDTGCLSFQALRDHPGLASRAADSQLFVKSHNIRAPLSSSTISTTWLHREFIQLCTSEPKVSIRSLASSRALDLGASRDHIVTLGNWASSSTFENHYQRNQMAQVDFTSTVLSKPMDLFFDAPDDFSGPA